MEKLLKIGTRIYHKENKKITGIIIGVFSNDAQRKKDRQTMYEIVCGGMFWVVSSNAARVIANPTDLSIRAVQGYKEIRDLAKLSTRKHMSEKR